MITFETLRFKNFMSYGNYFTTIDILSKKTTLISSKNGNGKSSMIDAITFVLYNKPYRKINKSQLVNTINGKDCVVEISFSIGTKAYKVIRGISPNIFELYVDGKLLNQDANVADQQKYLENTILKMSFKTFTQIVILGSATFIPFLELTPSNRRELIEEILDIKIFSTMAIFVKEELKIISEEINSENTKTQILKNKQISQEKLIHELSNINEQSLTDITNNIESYQKTISKLSADILELENDNAKILTQISELGFYEKEKNKFEKLGLTIDTKLKDSKKLQKFFTNHDDCPTCGQLIDVDFKTKKIEDEENKIQTYQRNIINIVDDMTKAKVFIKQKERLEKELNQKKNLLSNKKTEIRLAQQSIGNLKSDLKKVESKSNFIQNEDGELEDIKNSIDDSTKLQEFLKKKKKEYEIISFMLKDTGIKSKIIKKYLPIFNKLINKYLHEMGFSVNFILDENFDETIKSRHRDKFSYYSFSEGEKFRINLGILMAWKELGKIKNSVNCNLLFMDEVFDGSLDNEGIDNFMRILRNLDERTKIFVISHKGDVLLDKFDRVINVTKQKNFSKLTEEV